MGQAVHLSGRGEKRKRRGRLLFLLCFPQLVDGFISAKRGERDGRGLCDRGDNVPMYTQFECLCTRS